MLRKSWGAEIIRLIAFLFIAALNIASLRAQQNPAALAAKPLLSLGPAGSAVELSQPQRIRYDQRQRELYIVDTGHDRIVILDSRGLYIFDFSCQDFMHAPTDVACDSQGRIYVLASPIAGNYIQVFDYNGDYLRPFIFHNLPDSMPLSIGSFLIDDQDQLFVLDNQGARVLSSDLSGNYKSAFPVFDDLEEESRKEQVLGALSLSGDQFYIPAPMLGTVYSYSKNGSYTKTVGHAGGGYGELSFPIATASDMLGNVLVLDKHRHTIISFSAEGQVNGEIGGMGTGPGWFYHPTSLLVDEQNRIWVAQGFNNLVQALQLPQGLEPEPVPEENVIVVDE